MFNRLMGYLFGQTPDMRERHIRQLWMATVIALLASGIFGGLLYMMNIQGRI
jgi:hypothetical protein